MATFAGLGAALVALVAMSQFHVFTHFQADRRYLFACRGAFTIGMRPTPGMPFPRQEEGVITHVRGDEGGQRSGGVEAYLRFGAMVLTGMVVMYVVMYMGTYEWSHVQWSESRLFMALAMGGAMGLVMLAWMLNMYGNSSVNLGIVVGSVVLLALAVFLDRSQVTVEDDSFMSAMIPHHSLAITRAERSRLSDVRVCELAAEISATQRREIAELEWLITDIERNGVAESPAEADSRPVPEFEGMAVRQCPAR